MPIISPAMTSLISPLDKMAAISDDTFKGIFMNEIVFISIQISLKFVYKGPIDNIPTLV